MDENNVKNTTIELSSDKVCHLMGVVLGIFGEHIKTASPNEIGTLAFALRSSGRLLLDVTLGETETDEAAIEKKFVEIFLAAQGDTSDE